VYGWLQQANTWTGNQTITGTLAATQHQTDSSNYWTLSGGTNPVFVWDGVNDYTLYNRAGNTLSDVIGGVTVRSLNASGDMSITGALSAGSLNASQLGSGTVPVARLSGITTSQLSASAGITSAQIAALDAAKVTTGRLAEARMPYQYGSGTTNGSGVQTVTFGTAFLSTPVIFCQSKSFAANVINPTSVSTTGFTANAAIWNGSAFAAGAMDYNWVAIGPM
jgi:hypothetical protein